jgi:hypothetical protein
MWPSVFGPGWEWGVLLALAFLSLVLGVLGFLLLVVFRSSPEGAEGPDPLWHRVEEGDLTRAEFERIRLARSAQLRPGGAPK